MKRSTIILAIASLLVIGAVAAYLSGWQRPIDSVAAFRERYGVELRSTMVGGDGVRLHVVEAGSADGKLVVLLHGYPEFWWGWKEQIARLAKHGFHVVAIDQRGYNSSDKPREVEAYRVSELVADAVAVIDHYGGKAAVAGHDWGGVVAWRLAIEHPERLSHLAAVNMGHPLAFEELNRSGDRPEGISWYRTFFQIPIVPEVTGRMGNWFMLVKSLRDSSREGTFSDEELAHYRYAWDRDGAMRTMINWYRAGFRYREELQGDTTVQVPVRILWGGKDRFVPVELAALSAKHCRQAQVVVLDNAGHWVLHEEPELTSRQLIEHFSIPPPL
ncbi:MAG TPA: alpha/beta hydrolase [Terriglobales bacterium]|nr:alpha/beta hydrolase [Terriglobales bacterium]